MHYKMPLYAQIQDILLKEIEDQKYLPGEAIPSERKLAEKYAVNRMTIKRAIEKLVEEGYLIRKAGSGTFVAQKESQKVDIDYAGAESGLGMTAMLQKKGMHLSNRLLGCGEIPDNPYFLHKLGLKHGEEIWGIHRLRYADKKPFAVEHTYVSLKYFDDIEEFDFEKVSLYDYMEAVHHKPIYFSQNMIVSNANEKISSLLKIKKGSALFQIEAQGADKYHNIVEFTIEYVNPAFSHFLFNVNSR